MMVFKGIEKLNQLPRVQSIDEAKKYKKDVFLLPFNISYNFRSDSLFELKGLSPKWDNKLSDLIRVIQIEDPLNLQFNCTNVLTPLGFAETRNDILWHITTQGIFLSKITNRTTIDWIISENEKSKYKGYGKHPFDCFWLPFDSSVEHIKIGDTICVFNRRVAGWDGSIERPVIELLGAGGHLPTVYDEKTDSFRMLTFKENMQKETSEELGIHLKEDDIEIFGGYSNDLTHELVVLTGVLLPDHILPQVQDYAIQNHDGDTMGIYLGYFDETIKYYRKNPEPFAGGSKAAPTNFPNQVKLMERADGFLR